MDWDEVRTPIKTTLVLGEQLSALSIAELETRIKGMEAEIERVRAEIEVKRRHAAAADQIFRS